MSTDPVTGFKSGMERSQAAADAGGIPNRDDPAVVDTRAPHAVGGVGSAETYGLSGSGEAKHHSAASARLGAHPHHFQPISGGGGSSSQEHHAAGAASFEGQKSCNCVRDGKCTCQGTCKCSSCTGTHTEEQLAGMKGQPAHPRAGITGI